MLQFLLQQVLINDDFCGMDVNTPLGGSMPIEATPVLTYSGLLLTSVAATSTHDYTVAFMGTATGHLKKVSISFVCFARCQATAVESLKDSAEK